MASGTFPPDLPRQNAAELVEYDRYIEDQLRKTSSSVKLVDLSSSFMLMGASLLGFLFAAALIDHWLIPGGLPVWARTVLLLALLVAGGRYIWHTLWPLMWGRINPVYAAYTIERSTPTLKNSLLNFLLFRQNRETVPEPVYEAIEQQAAHRLSSVHVEVAVDHGHILRVGYVLIGIVLVCALYKVLSPKDPLPSAARVILPWANIAAPTRVAILEVQPGATTLVRGEKLVVSADIKGLRYGEPARVVYTSSDGQAVDRAVEMVIPDGDHRHQALIPDDSASGIFSPLGYRIEAGDAVSPTYRVDVISAPTIVVKRVRYEYPSYTGLTTREVQEEGDLKALEGTRVTIFAEANQPIQSASLDFDCDRRSDVTMSVKETEATVSFQLRLSEDRRRPAHASYCLRVTTHDGRHNSEPVEHRIEVLADLPPEVTLLAPQADEIEVRLNETVVIEAQAIDPDFGLRKVELRGQAKGKEPFKIPLLEDLRQGQFFGKYRFVPGRQGLAVGDEVEYWIAAEDNKAPDPNQAETAKKRMRITAPDPQQKQQRGNQGDQKGRAEQQPGDEGDQPDPLNPRQDQPQDQQPKQRQPKQQDQGQSQDGQQEPGEDLQDGDQQGPGEQNPGQADQENEEQHGEQQQGEQEGGQPGGGGEGQEGAEQQGEQGQGEPGAGQDGAGEQGAGQSGQQDGRSEPGEGQAGEGQESGGNSGQSQGGQQGQGKSGQQGEEQQPGEQTEDSSGQSRSGQSGQGAGQESQEPVANDGSDDRVPFEEVLKKLREQGKAPEQSADNQSPDGESSSGEQGQKAQKNSEQTSGDPQRQSQDQAGQQGEKPAGDQGQGAEKGQAQQKSEQQQPADESQRSGESQQSGEGDATKKPKASPGQEAGESQDRQPGEQGESGAKEAENGQDQSSDAQDGAAKQQRGTAGSGSEKRDQSGSPESQDGQKPNPAPKQQPREEDQARPDTQQPKSPAAGKRESNSDGDQGGEDSGGGEEGGGQRANKRGTGSAGQNTAADEGGGQSEESGGAGETGDQAGTDAKSDQATDRPGEKAQGQGTGTSQGDPAAAQESGETGDQGEQGDKQGEDSGKQGNKPSPGATDKAGAKGKPAESGEQGGQGGSGAKPEGGGQPGSDADAPQVDGPLEPGGDEAKQEYARKATDLVLKHLKDQLEQDKVDKDLLDRLGWNKNDLRKFVDRWEQMQRSARGSDVKSTRAKRELDEAIRSLGLGSGRVNRASGLPKDDLQQLKQSYRGSPPPEYAEQFRAYEKGLSRLRKGTDKADK